MKPLKVSENVVPIAQFKGQAGRWFKKAAESGQPVLVTQNGRPAGVVLSPAEFDRLVEREQLMADVAAGIADLEAGRTHALDDVRQEFARRRGSVRKRR